MEPVPVTIFSDFTCPFCYVTEAALWEREKAGKIQIRYRAYELYPAPAQLPQPDASEWSDVLEPFLSHLRLELTAPAFRARTRKAHEAARFAAEHARETPMRRAVYEAYWHDGRDIGRIDVLTDLIAGIRLDPDDLRIALDIDQYSEAVAHDAEVARQLRIPGAPTLFLGTGPTARILVGAQPAHVLDEAMGGG